MSSSQPAGHLIVECLVEQGVELAFGVPGESFLAVLDGFHAYGERIRFVVNRQEGGAAFMAEAHGKLTGCNGGGVLSAKFRGKGGGTISCTSGIATIKLKNTWNTTETSVISLKADLGSTTLMGTVKKGKFAGEDVTATDVTFTPVDGNCITSPLTKATITATVSL